MAIWIWVNICVGNGLLPDGIKPLPEQILTSPTIFCWGQLEYVLDNTPDKVFQNYIYAEKLIDFPGANEFKFFVILRSKTIHHPWSHDGRFQP